MDIREVEDEEGRKESHESSPVTIAAVISGLLVGLLDMQSDIGRKGGNLLETGRRQSKCIGGSG